MMNAWQQRIVRRVRERCSTGPMVVRSVGQRKLQGLVGPNAPSDLFIAGTVTFGPKRATIWLWDRLGRWCWEDTLLHELAHIVRALENTGDPKNLVKHDAAWGRCYARIYRDFAQTI